MHYIVQMSAWRHKADSKNRCSHSHLWILQCSGHLGCKVVSTSKSLGLGSEGIAAMARAAKSKPRKKTEKASSSGTSSPHSSSSPSPRERVGNYDLLNLATTWDNHEIIRDRLREDHNLLRGVHDDGEVTTLTDKYVEGNVQTVRANQIVLEPLVEIMGANDRLVPNLDNLIQCIDCLYRKAKKPRLLEHCYQQAWGLRRLIQVVKNQCYRKHPPEDCSCKNHHFYIWLIMALSCFQLWGTIYMHAYGGYKEHESECDPPICIKCIDISTWALSQRSSIA